MLYFDPAQEGACLLYDGLTGKTLLGQNPQKHLHDLPETGRKPVIGYLAYPNPSLKNEIPDQLFYEYLSLVVISTEAKRSREIPYSLTRKGFLRFGRNDNGSYSTSGRLEQSVTKTQYFKKIHQIKELLAAGEAYQINYAIRFRKKCKGDPYTLFLRLAQTNPAAFSAYLNCGHFQIVSASPERLLKIHNRTILTQPIKGTAPKILNFKYQIPNHKQILNTKFQITNKFQIKRDKNLQRLLNSEKERAELDMITDLERNDVGKICEHGTVKLVKERAVMELPNLWHTYSEIQGRLRPEVSLGEAMKALFPGGSITGCPKLRAMEYIEKLEGLPRNIFTGSIGYITSGKGYAVSGKSLSARLNPYRLPLIADFNITIRTALIHQGYVEYWAGGGIVFDSDQEKEYEECRLKAEKFLALL